MKHQKDNIEKIFGEAPIINVDLILGYINGTLTPVELHKIEKILVDDPFFNDAIEGLKDIPEEQRKTLVYEILGKEPSKQFKLEIHPMVWKIAAVTVIAISSIYFITLIDFTSVSEEVAMQEAPTEEKPSNVPTPERKSKGKIIFTEPNLDSTTLQQDSAMSEIALAMEDNAEMEMIELSPKPEVIAPSIVEVNEEMELAEDSFMDAEGNAANVEADYAVTGSVSRSANVEGLAYKEDLQVLSKSKKAISAPRSNNAIAIDMITTLKRKGIVEGSHSSSSDKSSLSKKEASAQSSFEEGLAAYNRGNYHSSVKRFEEALKQNKNLPEIRYYLATSHLYGNNNVSKAKKVFKIDNTGKYQAEKEWVDAIIELGDGKTKNAKEKLQKISNAGGKFKKDADLILSEMN